MKPWVCLWSANELRELGILQADEQRIDVVQLRRMRMKTVVITMEGGDAILLSQESQARSF